jgi:hypothetical protein
VRKLIAAIVALGGVAAVAATVHAPVRRVTRAGYPTTPSADFLKVVGKSHISLIADLYWLKLINVSGTSRTAMESREAYVYGTLVTDLDPKFKVVYWFAGLNLPYAEDRTWRNADLASELYAKGYAQFPDDLKITMLYAQNELLFLDHRAKAAELLQHASQLPGAPEYAAGLAMRLQAQQGEFDGALAFATELYRHAHSEADRALFEKRIKEIVTERTLQTVDKAIAQYKQRLGVPPTTVAELVIAGDLIETPEDPMGGVVVIGADGRSHSTKMQKRLEPFLDKKDHSNLDLWPQR